MLGDRSAVIIGGGITGAMTARDLCDAGWDVTLLEAAHIGAGSSSRTAAGIRQQFSTPGTVRGMRWSTQFYLDWQAHTGGQRSPIVQNGYLFLYNQADLLDAAQARVRMQQASGLDDVELIRGAALRDRWPWVGDSILGGSWCPTDGFLHPEVVYMDAIRRARELNATIVQKAPVTGCSVNGERILSVHTPKGHFSADVFIDCTNAWSPRLGQLLGAEALPISPLKRYLWFLQRGPTMTAETLLDMPLVICPDGLYVRPENADSLMMGKKHDATAEPQFNYEDQDTIGANFAHNGGIDAVPFEMWMAAAEILPPLEGFEGFSATTAGFYGTTPDHNPFMGFDRKRTNLMRLVGFSGHGAMFGPFTARVARTLAEAGRDVPEVDLDGERVALEAFAIGRSWGAGEGMVI
jgi:glycine/D-amino acid oxidase-like deaminating enzyme